MAGGLVCDKLFCFTVIACAALAFLLTPLCQYIAGSAGLGAARGAVCGRYSAPELAAALLAAGIVAVWVLTGHWLLMDGEYTRTDNITQWLAEAQSYAKQRNFVLCCKLLPQRGWKQWTRCDKHLHPLH